MSFITANQHSVSQGETLSWIMQGAPGRNAGLPFSLQIQYVKLPDGRTGVVLDPSGTQLPDEIEAVGSQPFDTGSYKGRTVWLTGMNGMWVTFEGNRYTLFSISEVGEDLYRGTLYFHAYPPKEFGSGEIVYSDDQWLE